MDQSESVVDDAGQVRRTTVTSGPDAAERYVELLRYELRHARKSDREDYVVQISDHLSESRALVNPDDPKALSDLLGRVGSPQALAKEFYAAERATFSVPQRVVHWTRRWWIGIVLVLAFASIVTFEVWAATYQPLGLNMNGAYFDNVVALSGKPPVKLSEGPIAPITWKLTDGRYRLSILFDAENTGSHTVTISPPEFVPGWGLLDTWHLQSASSSVQTPFHSVQVKGHWYQEIVFSKIVTCTPWPKGNPNAGGGETSYVANLPIVMSFWGHQHTLELAVQPFYLQFAGDCSEN